MAYITSEARQELLDTVAEAIDELGIALAALGDAYGALDEAAAEALEDGLFRPVQAAYGRAKRTHSAFAARHGLPEATFQPAAPNLPSTGVKGFVEAAAEAVERSQDILIELQDSMSPVEVGDADLRAGLADVREALSDISQRSERFLSRFGR